MWDYFLAGCSDFKNRPNKRLVRVCGADHKPTKLVDQLTLQRFTKLPTNSGQKEGKKINP